MRAKHAEGWTGEHQGGGCVENEHRTRIRLGVWAEKKRIQNPWCVWWWRVGGGGGGGGQMVGRESGTNSQVGRTCRKEFQNGPKPPIVGPCYIHQHLTGHSVWIWGGVTICLFSQQGSHALPGSGYKPGLQISSSLRPEEVERRWSELDLEERENHT